SCSYCASPSDSLPLSFFFRDTATTELYTLSLHDALPISDVDLVVDHHHPHREPVLALARRDRAQLDRARAGVRVRRPLRRTRTPDRKSTRLNSSHRTISYAVFCLKKKKQKKNTANRPQQN